MSAYWTVSYGQSHTNKHKCRECGIYFKIGDSLTIRDGRKIRLFYHSQCFSGIADPRSQNASIKNIKQKNFQSAIQKTAPKFKGVGKWSVKQYGYQDSFHSSRNKFRTAKNPQQLKDKEEDITIFSASAVSNSKSTSQPD